ncbi:YafY family protein [Bacillus sp. 03113]|uniref:helix-turn-helix transcriptional regulator n=1 Tax=Bacillus sp. 03113 TaxID=2578211 RepID=UPI001144F538|nr:HTH domain-containing protein [Bacillus sp. 03113]
MAKANRLMDIWLYITEKRRFQAQEIADEFQLSVRTVNRYMNDLADLGIPIMSVQGRGGGFELLNNGLLPPISFTEEETLSIFFAYHALRNYHQLPFEAEYSSVTRKLYNLLAKNKKMQVDKFSEHLAFRIPKRQLKTPYLRPLMNASLNKNEIKIAYHPSLV